MPPQRDVDVRYARALAEPLRIGVLTVLRDGPLGESALAARLGADAHAIARAGRELEELGFVARRGRPPVYELIEGADFPDAVWEQLPTPVKQAAVSATLAQIRVATAAAVDAGGFDRPDMRLARTSLRLDEQGWSAVAAEALEFLARIEEEQAQAAERLAAGAPDVPAEAVLMLFSPAAAHAEAGATHEPEAFTTDEGLERAYALQESIEELLAGAAPDWAAIVARVDELRVVVRAAANADTAVRAPAPSRAD